jgi:hypothetical protein
VLFFELIYSIEYTIMGESRAIFNLSAARLSEQRRLIFRRLNHEVVPFVAALIKAHAALWVADQLVFGFLQLERIHVKSRVDGTGIEQELMSRNREQRLRQFADMLHIEILQILRREDDGALFFADALHAVADIFDGGQVCEKQVQLVDAGRRVAGRQKLVAHVGQHVEQQGVAQVLAGVEHAFHAEGHEFAAGDIRVAVEKLGLRSLAHGVEPETDFPQGIRRIELAAVLVEILVFRFDEVIQIGQDGIILRLQAVEVAVVGDAPFLVELAQHDFDGVDFPV